MVVQLGLAIETLLRLVPGATATVVAHRKSYVVLAQSKTFRASPVVVDYNVTTPEALRRAEAAVESGVSLEQCLNDLRLALKD